jgi:alkanesulfonate monooxygenase SsuD/methylene tetrahydromethanopterin reductase-like flavin-dependent oxidoreductase (luciferase family)
MATRPVGVFLPTMTGTGEPLADVVAAARRAEALGFESAWAVDQLVAGTGNPFVDSTVALAAAAGATTELRLGYGVMILPLHSPVWAAKQVGSLQAISGGRVVFGVGVGGDRHELSWAAAGVPKAERGRRTDAALAVMRDLIAGRSAEVGDLRVQLSPGVAMPPILVGGMSDAALERTVRAADGWFSLPLPAEQLRPFVERLRERFEDLGRPAPTNTASMMVAIDGDPTLPDKDELVHRLTDPDGMFGIPAEGVPDVLVTGGPAAVAERIDSLAELGIERVVATVAGGDWFHQVELLAEAAA